MKLSMTIALATALTTFGDEARLLEDEFDGETSLEWVIENEDTNAYSLTERPGELMLTTTYGCAHAGCRTLPRNTFFLKDNIPHDRGFQLTLAISEFEPQTHFHQVALLVHQSTTSYVKFCCERSNSKADIVAMFYENAGQRIKPADSRITLDGPIWLRLTRAGDEYTSSFSNDGDQFVAVGTQKWQPDTPNAPLRLGFAAYNGRNRKASDIDVSIESFQLKLAAPQ